VIGFLKRSSLLNRVYQDSLAMGRASLCRVVSSCGKSSSAHLCVDSAHSDDRSYFFATPEVMCLFESSLGSLSLDDDKHSSLELGIGCYEVDPEKICGL